MTLPETSNTRDGNRGTSAGACLPRVLIVDDSVDSANSLKILFSLNGYEARVAYDWATALDTAKAHLPDIILLDLAMPEMDGVHLARFFREDEQLKEKVLIAVTGYSDDRHRQECDAVGIDFILPKPVTWKELKSTIDRLWPKR